VALTFNSINSYNAVHNANVDNKFVCWLHEQTTSSSSLYWCWLLRSGTWDSQPRPRGGWREAGWVWVHYWQQQRRPGTLDCEQHLCHWRRIKGLFMVMMLMMMMIDNVDNAW